VPLVTTLLILHDPYSADGAGTISTQPLHVVTMLIPADVRCNHKATCTEPSKQYRTSTELARPIFEHHVLQSSVDCAPATCGHLLELRALAICMCKTVARDELRCSRCSCHAHGVCFPQASPAISFSAVSYTPKAHAYSSQMYLSQHNLRSFLHPARVHREVPSHVK
jgi:hypothetical protein